MPENDDMDRPVTRRELREELAVFVTRDEFRRELEIWAKHIIEATERAADARERRFEDRWERRLDVLATKLSAEIAQHAKATQEYVATQIRVVDEKYQDLPERVARLERRRRR